MIQVSLKLQTKHDKAGLQIANTVDLKAVFHSASRKHGSLAFSVKRSR